MLDVQLAAQVDCVLWGAVTVMKIACLCLLFLLSGCAAWRSGAVSPGMATIYIYREAGGASGLYSKPVMIDDRLVGKLSGNGYLVVAVKPGEHVISSPAANPASLRLVAEPGKTYYVSQEIIATVPSFHVLLNRVGEERGKQSVARARRLY